MVFFIAILILIAGVLPGLWPALSAARVERAAGARLAGREYRGREAVAAAAVAGRRADRRLDHVPRHGGAVRPVRTRTSCEIRSSASPATTSSSPSSSRRRARLRHRRRTAICRVGGGARARAPGVNDVAHDRPRAVLHRLRPHDRRVAADRRVRGQYLPEAPDICGVARLLPDDGHCPRRGA